MLQLWEHLNALLGPALLPAQRIRERYPDSQRAFDHFRKLPGMRSCRHNRRSIPGLLSRRRYTNRGMRIHNYSALLVGQTNLVKRFLVGNADRLDPPSHCTRFAAKV